MTLSTLAIDIQLHISCYRHLQQKCIVHVQCLQRVDGSILAGVLTSSFCVVPV